jgi:hypothetical protein
MTTGIGVVPPKRQWRRAVVDVSGVEVLVSATSVMPEHGTLPLDATSAIPHGRTMSVLRLWAKHGICILYPRGCRSATTLLLRPPELGADFHPLRLLQPLM